MHLRCRPYGHYVACGTILLVLAALRALQAARAFGPCGPATLVLKDLTIINTSGLKGLSGPMGLDGHLALQVRALRALWLNSAPFWPLQGPRGPYRAKAALGPSGAQECSNVALAFRASLLFFLAIRYLHLETILGRNCSCNVATAFIFK